MSAIKQPQAPPLTDGGSIELLTSQALAAALAGNWDLVDACYTARGSKLDAGITDRTLVQRLSVMDEQVRTAILVAQAGVAGLLADAAQVTRRLRRLRENNGHLSSESRTLHHEA